MVNIEILAKNNNQTGNIQIANFLKKNIKTLVKVANVRFKFTIIEKGDEKKLIKKGIKNVPACISNNNIYSGANEIIEYLSDLVNKIKESRESKERRSYSESQSPEDEVRNFMENEMTPEALERDKRDEEDDPSKSTDRKLKEWQENQKTNKVSKRFENSKRQDNIKIDSSRESTIGSGRESTKDILDALRQTKDKDEELLASLYDES